MGNLGITGASSGLDFSAVIEALTALQNRSIQTLQGRIATATSRKSALLGLSSSLLGVQSAASPLSDPSYFGKSVASSGNESVLLATSSGAVTGSYIFDVRRLAQAQQARSGGFASATAALGLSGTISIEVGSQGMTRPVPLESLRGGAGVDRGTIVLRQTVGATTTSATVDLRAAETVQDVVDAVNGAGMPVSARVEGDRVLLQYSGTGTLEVLNGAGDTTASDFGLAGTLAAGETRFGANVNFITASTSLSTLNDGAGVRMTAGTDFTITTVDGSSFGVDLGSVSTVGDVLTAIGTATGGAVVASVGADGHSIELSDTTVPGGGNLTVTPAAGSNAALDLGLLVSSELAGDPSALAGRDFLSGSRVIGDLNGLLARSLNGGTSLVYPDGTVPAATDIQGVDSGSIAVTDTAGGVTTVDLSARRRTAVTMVVAPDTLRIAGGADIRAGMTIRLTDGTTNETAVVQSTSAAGGGAYDVTFTAPVSAGVGAGAFRGAETVAAIEAEINRAGAGLFEAVRKPEGNGFVLRDLAGGAGTLSVAESGSTTARDLGLITASSAGSVTATSISSPEFVGMDALTFVNRTLTVTGGAGSGFTATVTAFDPSTGKVTLSGDPSAAGVIVGDPFRISSDPARVTGADVDPALLTENTTLASLNGGRGVQAGKMRITDRGGVGFTVDLSQPDDRAVKDVVEEINAAAGAAGSTLRARINDAGDGILLSQAAGAGAIRVDEVAGGRTARDLRLLGTAPPASPGTVDGSYEIRTAVSAGDSLNGIVTSLNALGIPVSASTVNDGSLVSPFHLTMLSILSGVGGRVIIDTNIASLSMAVTGRAQDSLVLSGGGGGTDATIIRGSTNTLTGAVPGLTLDLRGTGGPVTVSVRSDTGAVKDAIRSLVDSFNSAADTIGKLGAFDTTTNTPAALFGDPTLGSSRRDLYNLFNTSASGLPSGSIRDLPTMGVRMGKDGRLFIDEASLDAALASRPDEVRDFFSASRGLALDTKLADFRNGLGIGRAGSGDDLKITQHDGTSVSVGLAGVTTVAQLLDRVNTDPENTGDLVASISADGRSIRFADASAGPASLRVEALNGSPAAAQLGILKSVDGSPSLAGDTVDLTNDLGLARRIIEKLASFTDAPEGLITRKASGIDESIALLNDRIEAGHKRVDQTVERLTRRFAALEDFLALNNSTLSLLQRTLIPFTQSLKTSNSGGNA